MNPLVMIVVAIVIAAEKLVPRPAIVARLVGISAIIAGIASFCAVLLRQASIVLLVAFKRYLQTLFKPKQKENKMETKTEKTK